MVRDRWWLRGQQLNEMRASFFVRCELRLRSWSWPDCPQARFWTLLCASCAWSRKEVNKMSNDLFIVVAYLVVSGGARIRGIFRRWQQPVLRGPEWFFNVHVRPDFYAGQGHKILRGYRMRMLM